MSKKAKWSEFEIDIVKKHYPLGGVKECQKYINRSKYTIHKKAQEFNIKRKCYSKYYKNYDEEKLKLIIKDSKSFADVARKMNYARASGFLLVKKFIKEYNIDISHFDTQQEQWRKSLISLKNTIPLEQILIENSTYNRNHLKKRLYKENIKKEKCEMCGQGPIWMGKKISLILDHINGVRNDNRINNLRIVCPNCNASLDTHCGKNKHTKNRCLDCGQKCTKNAIRCKKCSNLHLNTNLSNCILLRKVDRPPYSELKKEIEQNGYSATGRKYGVSDNAIRKWIKYYEKNITL